MPAQIDPTPEESIANEIVLEATLSEQGNHPLFILVYYQNEVDKKNLIWALNAALKKKKMTSWSLDAQTLYQTHLTRFYDLLAEKLAPGRLALVTELPRETADSRGQVSPVFFSYLNLHRDRIARDRIRFLLFLKNDDAEDFISLASDLWDVRHNAYWLEGSSAVLKKSF
jgi:hypothetical protein